ncbi:MAG: hypothetical protein EA401_03050 [Planctomycetota bacterium]|nr:MAG: hypothetical protein EA401_03050 [Planctomycetota bacterium]
MPDIDPELYADDSSQRLAALTRLRQQHPRPAAQGTNTHVHTNYSFSAFRSPAEAAWLAYESGVEVFGINDHYTVDGHKEFAQSCQALGIAATFSIEAVGMDQEAAQEGVLLNDPGNPGRIYLCGKGISDARNTTAAAMLATLRSYQSDRNRAMLELVQQRFQRLLEENGPQWEEIEEQTPLGNTTERHIARAIYHHLQRGSYSQRYTTLIGSEPSGDAAQDQNAIRGALLKAGKPCYVREAPEAYPALSALRGLYLKLGAIPTYPVLGNPITGGEEDIEALFERLARWGIHAVELIPHRNTDDRVAAVIAAASARGWPVFDGTEHNTPVLDPLLTRWGSDPRFRPVFREGALVLLGHQSLRASKLDGYVDSDGKPCSDGYQRCLAAGEEVLERANTCVA